MQGARLMFKTVPKNYPLSHGSRDMSSRGGRTRQKKRDQEWTILAAAATLSNLAGYI